MQRVLFLTACSFFVGVAWRSLVPVSIYVLGFLAILAGATLLVAWLRSFHGGLLVFAVICGLVLGVARTELAYEQYENGRIFEDGQIVSHEAIVVSEPDVRDEHTNLTVAVRTPIATTQFIVRVPHYPSFSYGDRVFVEGEVHTPEAFITDTGRTFAYDGYLMKDGVHYELRNAHIDAREGRDGNPLVRGLLTLKATWLDAVSRTVPEPSSSLLGGVVVGAKRSLGEEWLTAFRDTGLIHIVVLSGYNLTIIAVFIVWLTKRFSRKVRLTLGLASIAGFALMTGAGATVVRASIMASLALIAQFLSRPYVLLRALLVAATLMVLYNPLVLLFDTGFQLSFIATLGLITISPLVEAKLTRVPAFLGLRTIVSATLATQMAVLPLLLYQIGNASLVAPLVNVLVLPVVPFVMAVGFAAGVVGVFSSGLAMPLALVTHGVLSYIFGVVSVFENIPYASVTLPPVPLWVLLGMYALGAYLVYRAHTQH